MRITFQLCTTLLPLRTYKLFDRTQSQLTLRRVVCTTDEGQIGDRSEGLLSSKARDQGSKSGAGTLAHQRKFFMQTSLSSAEDDLSGL